MSSSWRTACAVLGLLLATFAGGRDAWAQACCAGASAITPGRLALHERALLGLQLRAAWSLGSYDAHADYRPNVSGSTSLDLQQDLFAAVRVLERGQVGLLMPVLASFRISSTTDSEFGGGIGDVNLNARYDFVWARELSYFPGLGLLLGVTLPTGRPAESASLPLGSDATGVGATQLSTGLALEREFGRFLVNLSGIAAWRANRDVYGVTSRLGTQFTGILGASHPLVDQTVLASTLSYATEGNARVDGEVVANSGRRLLRVAVGPSSTLSDSWRVGGNLFLDPPLDGVGQNQLAAVGAGVSVVGSVL